MVHLQPVPDDCWIPSVCVPRPALIRIFFTEHLTEDSYPGDPLVNQQFAIENGHFLVDLLMNTVIFHGYVSFPEGIYLPVLNQL